MKTIKISLLVILVLVVVGVGFSAYQNKSKKPQQSNQETVRQRDISEIKKFSGSQDIDVEFVSTSKSSYNTSVPVNVYSSGVDQYELNADTAKVIQFESRDLPVGSESARKSDSTIVYTQEELETKARQFILEKAPDLNLDKLTTNHGNKNTNYFFRWEDRTTKTTEGYPFIQAGFSQNGILLNYINAF